MDTGTIIFAAVIMLAIVIPVTIMNKNRNNKEKRFLQSLSDLARKCNCKISEHQLLNNTLIGVDKEARQMFFIRRRENTESEAQVNLNEMQKCLAVNTSRSVRGSGSNYIVTERIELAFTPLAGNCPETFFEFYNSDYDSLTLQGELQLAEKWAVIANKMITNSRNK